MSFRIPPSLKWLLKQRKNIEANIQVANKRLASDLQTLESNRRSVEREHEILLRQLRGDLAAINHALQLHEVRVPHQTTVETNANVVLHPRRSGWGVLTRYVLAALAIRAPQPMTTTEVTAYVVANGVFDPPIEDFSIAREKVRWRLKALCAKGKLVRVHTPRGRNEGLWLSRYP
jgi:hypothetical protein